jgi:hypothetical protein
VAGFKTDGTINFNSVDSGTVVLLLKSSAGREIKTWEVPASESDKFMASIQAEEESLRKGAGETDPLRLIKISKVF